MVKHVFAFRCPCCKKRLELDTRSGRAREIKLEDTPESKGLEGLLDEHKSEPDRLADQFAAARDAHTKEDERLDQLFRDAREKSKDDDSKPPNPFDLD